MAEPKTQKDFRNKAERIIENSQSLKIIKQKELIDCLSSALFEAFQDGVYAQITENV